MRNSLSTKEENILRFAEAGFRLCPLGHKETPNSPTDFLLPGKIPPLGFPKIKFNPKPNVSKFPHNYGIILDHDHLVIDVDPRNFPDGENVWRQFQTNFGLNLEKMAGCKQRTGGGGLHLFFKKPSKIRIVNTLDEYPGIEFKSGTGRQVVGPGSIHPLTGKTYELIEGSNPGTLFDIPDEILRAITRTTQPLEKGIGTFDDSEGNIKLTRIALQGHPPAIEGERGDETTFRAACICRDNGVSQPVALDLLAEYNERCQPPWSLEELEIKIRNAYRYGQNALGCANPRADFDAITDEQGEKMLATAKSGGRQGCQFNILKPLPAERLPVPSMTPDFLPKRLKSWLVESAQPLCVPLEYVAVPAIVAAGAAIGKKIAIMPRGREDWMVYPNLWGAIVGPPSAKKTPSLDIGLSPLRSIADEEFRKYAEAKQHAEIEKEYLREEIGKLQTAINRHDKEKSKKSNKDDEPKINLETLHGQLEAAQTRLSQVEPKMKRLIANDCTFEKLGEILKDNPDGVLVFRDELYGLIESCKKKGAEGYREFLLEGFNASGSYTFDRIQRGTIYIPSLCLSVIGGFQPSKFSTLVKSATGGGIGDDGLLQRLQLTVWPDSIPPFKLVDSRTATKVLKHVGALYRKLAGYDFDYGCQFPTVASSGAPAVTFDPEIQWLFDSYLTEIEQEIRSESMKERPALASHLGKYPSLIPKLALIFHVIDAASEESKNPRYVSRKSLSLALKWADFLRAHAEKIYFDETKPEIRPAQLLAKKIVTQHIPDKMSVRDIGRSKWSGLTVQDDIDRGLQVLEECGWIKIEVQGTTGGPSRIVRVNPLAVGAVFE